MKGETAHCTQNKCPVILLFRLPEVPPDTPDTNPIMRVHDHPKFSEVTPESVVTGCAKLSIDHDVALGSHLESMAGRFIAEISL